MCVCGGGYEPMNTCSVQLMSLCADLSAPVRIKFTTPAMMYECANRYLKSWRSDVSFVYRIFACMGINYPCIRTRVYLSEDLFVSM